MAFNLPLADSETIDDVVESELYKLVEALRRESVIVDMDDLQWDLFQRCESICLPSECIFPNEDLPRLFGVHRGYLGGGLHSGLVKTEIDRISKNRIKKAERLLGLFENCFWAIMKRADGASEQ